MILPENQPLKFTLRVNSAYKSHPGRKRGNNEDYVASYEPNDSNDLTYSGCLYIVADGVGGASKGEKASKYATEKVMFEYYQHPEELPEERLRAIVRNVGLEIHEYTAQSGFGQMATTMVAAVIRGNRLIVANVGDSRAYLIRDGISHQITRDHNQLSELLQSGAITAEEGRKSKTGNILTRSVGGHEDINVDVFLDTELIPGDIVILCSDGLHKYLDDVDLASLIPDDSPTKNAQQLVHFANQAGGNDNITVLVVHINAAQGMSIRPRRHSFLTPPESLDTMKTEKRFMHYHGFEKKQYQWAILLLVLPAMMLAVILWVFGDQVWVTLFPAPSATATSDEVAESAPVQAKPTMTLTAFHPVGTNSLEFTPTPRENGATHSTATAYPTPQPLPMATYLPTLETGNCVHKSQEGLGIEYLLQLFTVPYAPDKPYVAYQKCDSDKRTCSGKREIKPENHDSLGITEYLLIDEIKSKDACLAKNGIWITTFE